MTVNAVMEKEPLWLLMESKIQELSDQDLSEGSMKTTIQRVAKDLDDSGYNVSLHGGNWLKLRMALDARVKIGRPLMKDFNDAVDALQLEDVTDPYKAAMNIINKIGGAWPKMLSSEHRPEVLKIVEKTRLNLMVTMAKSLQGDEGIRYLISQEISPEIIIASMGVSEAKYKEVNAAVEAERAEKIRVQELLDAVSGKSEAEKIKHLIQHNTAEALIIELACVSQGAIDAVNKAMEAETAEKKRLEEAAAAKKAAEAAGPSLDSISNEDMLEYIEGLREILDFSDKENEIRTMCTQSSIPQCLADIAVSDPGKLDELEEKAQG